MYPGHRLLREVQFNPFELRCIGLFDGDIPEETVISNEGSGKMD